jgi:uncharacterized membrane protein
MKREGVKKQCEAQWSTYILEPLWVEIGILSLKKGETNYSVISIKVYKKYYHGYIRELKECYFYKLGVCLIINTVVFTKWSNYVKNKINNLVDKKNSYRY